MTAPAVSPYVRRALAGQLPAKELSPYGAPAMLRPCDHCRRTYRRPIDVDRTEPDYYLCPDCADMSVWAVHCSECERIPTATRPCTPTASAD